VSFVALLSFIIAMVLATDQVKKTKKDRTKSAAELNADIPCQIAPRNHEQKREATGNPEKGTIYN